jgi:hypothetical protein
MDAVTYPKPEVSRLTTTRFVPPRVAHTHQLLSARFKVHNTPTRVALDAEGNEHHRSVGLLEPEELIPSLLLGLGKVHFDRGESLPALAALAELLAPYPDSQAAPEATRLQALARSRNIQARR